MKQVTRSNALLVFVRSPEPGKVKTRLAKSIGNERAAEFYRLCIDVALEESRKLSPGIEKYICLAEPVDVKEMERLGGLGFKIAVQEGGSLGQRLCNTFNRILGNGARKAVIVASDVPDLSARVMEEAISSLDSNDVVIGPCYDGGYYLLGLKALCKELFTGISWGTEQVCRQTLDAAREKNLKVHQLPTLFDIDTVADLRQWSQLDGNKKPTFMDFIKSSHL